MTSTPTDLTTRQTNKLAHDQDFFRLEPQAFDDSAGVLAKGTDGEFVAAGFAFTSASADFVSREIAAGDVIELQGASETLLARVTAVGDLNSLTLARLETIGGTGEEFDLEATITYQIKTLDWYYHRASYELGVNRLRLDDPNKKLTDTDTGDDYTNIWNPEPLCLAVAHRTLAIFFESRNHEDEDSPLARKARYHREQSDQLMITARVILKEEGSDRPTEERSLGSLQLSRG